MTRFAFSRNALILMKPTIYPIFGYTVLKGANTVGISRNTVGKPLDTVRIS